MAFTKEINLVIATLQHQSGAQVRIPIQDVNSLRVDQDISSITLSFANAFQKKQIDQGIYQSVLDLSQGGEMKTGSIQVEFPASGLNSKLTHPALNLQFDFYSQETKRGIWAGVPALGVEAFAATEKKIKDALIQSIQLEFARKNRFQAIQTILSTLWFEQLNLETGIVKLNFYTPSELEALQVQNQEELLPSVAKELNISQIQAFNRESELDQLIRTIKSQFNRNILLVGPSGVGKTALIWELARVAYKNKIKATFWETTASTMIKELTQDLGWQANLPILCRELARRNDFLFVRNLLELFEVGQYEGNSVSMADFLRDYLARGEVSLISECSDEEYARIEMRSPNFVSLFQVIRLEEPDPEALLSIIEQKLGRQAKKQSVTLIPEAIRETIRLQKRYAPYSGFPGKPIRFLETLMLNTIKRSDRSKGKKARLMNRSDVIAHFCEEAGMPAFMIDPEVPMDLNAIQEYFQNNIFGQQEAVRSVVDLLASVKTALTRQGKPIASFLFVGPTGVGKTEMAKVLAQFMFGNRERMIRFDMSEYSNAWSIQRLTGESYFQDGTLTSAIRREPFSVLLFDEIEKAHPLFYDLLLQLLSEGRLTDSSGKLVNFCSTIIIMTSNIGAANLQSDRIGWTSGLDTQAVNQHFMSAVEKHFRPELFNRIDKIVPFDPISQEVVSNVIQRELGLLQKREGILHRKINFLIEPEVVDYLAKAGYDPKYGARKLQRTLHESVIIPLANKLNLYDFDDQLIVRVVMQDKKPVIHIEADPLKIDLLLEELARNEWTDHVSTQRRSIHRLQEGRFYIQLLSKLDILERDKKRQKENFWRNEKVAKQYSFYLHTKDRVDKMTKTIEAYEQELALTAMGLSHYDTTIIKRTENWEADYLDLKLDLYGQLNQGGNLVYFGLYGFQIKPFFPIMLEVLELRGFSIDIQFLWYRESYYKELLEITPDFYDIHDHLVPDSSLKVGQKTMRKSYVKIPFIPGSQVNPFSEPAAEDILVGVQFQVKGRAAFLYLEEEIGLMKWKTDKGEQLTAALMISQTPVISTELHRKKFYQNLGTLRTFGDQSLQDSHLEINRETTKQLGHAELILKGLDKLFSKKLDRSLM